MLFVFNKKLNILVQTKAASIESLELTPENAFIAILIAKVIKTHNAILILCKERYGEDATVLVRSLLEALIDVSYIFNEKTRERTIRYMEYSWIIKKQYLESLCSHPEFNGYVEGQIHTMEDNKIKEEAARVQKKYNYKKGWSDKNRWEMAKEIGMQADYDMGYGLMCSLAHTDVMGLDNYA